MICETSVRDGKAQFHLPGRKLPLCWIPYPPPSIVDVDGDGQPGLVLSSSYGAVYWARAGYICHGYAESRITAVEAR